MIRNECIGYDILNPEDLMSTVEAAINERKDQIKALVKSKQVIKDKCIGEIKFFNTPDDIDEENVKATVRVVYSQDGRNEREIRLDYYSNEEPDKIKSVQLPNYGEYVDGHLQFYNYYDKLYDFYMNDGFNDIFNELESITKSRVLDHSCFLLDTYDISDLSRSDFRLEMNRYGDLVAEVDVRNGECFRFVESLENIIDKMDKNALDYLNELVKNKQKEISKHAKEVER